MSNSRKLLIALDGPGASGKGNIGRRLAKHFDLSYLDTGKLYRAVAWDVMQQDRLNVEDITSESEAGKFAISSSEKLTLEQLDNSELGGEDVAAIASRVSALMGVRAALLGFQHKVAYSEGGAVLDGRDIGTVVCPDADFKFYITASLEKRAQRRYKELQKQNDTIIYEQILEDLRKRDERDAGKAISPMTIADDATLIDTTQLTIEESFEKVVAIINA